MSLRKLRLFTKQSKIAADHPVCIDYHCDVWSDTDNARLQSIIDPVRATQPRVNALGFMGSEAMGLVCAPKDSVYERTITFLTGINIMSGLVFSAIVELATSPVDIEELAADKKTLGQVYNTMAYICVTTQISLVMFSTYLLFFIAAHGHTSAQVYRAVAYSGPLLGMCQLATFLPMHFYLILLAISAHLQFSSSMAWICTGVVIVIYGGYHLLFVYYLKSAFPHVAWNWAAVGAPWFLLDKSLQQEAARMNLIQMTGMDKGVLAGKDENRDGKVDVHQAMTKEGRKLQQWLDKALPDLMNRNEPVPESAARIGGLSRKESFLRTRSVRRDMLLRALIADGLTLQRLTEAASLPGGFQVLINMLHSTGDFSKGERLALASAAMKAAAVKTAAAKITAAEPALFVPRDPPLK